MSTEFKDRAEECHKELMEVLDKYDMDMSFSLLITAEGNLPRMDLQARERVHKPGKISLVKN